MSTYVAFLRGMNLGGRRITNAALCGHFETLDCRGAQAFLASGNVVFDPPEPPPSDLAGHLEHGLQELLDYPVPTFLRSADEARAIAEHEPFSAEELAGTAGKVQVALLLETPDADARATALACATDDDRLAIHGRELYWLPKVGISTSDLDLKTIERVLGSMTVRTHRTLTRLVAKFFA